MKAAVHYRRRNSPLGGWARITTPALSTLESPLIRGFLRQPVEVALPIGWTDDDFEAETLVRCPRCRGIGFTDIVPVVDPEEAALAIYEQTGRVAPPAQGRSPGVFRRVACSPCHGTGMVPAG